MKNTTILLGLLILTSQFVWSQESLRSFHREKIDHGYRPIDKSKMERGPSYEVRASEFITTQVNVDSDGNDIIGDAGNEPSLAVDPTNPNRIVVGWRQFDDISSNFRQAGYGYSLDGGFTFTFPGVINPGLFRSDPVLDFDAEGNFYYNSLQGDFSCDVFQITDGGTEWSGPSQAKGGDKQWMRLDRSGGIGNQNNYSFWNSDFSTCFPGSFTRSTDGSSTFEDCVLVDGDPYWGTLAVDKDGVLFLTGQSGANIVIVKSTNAQVEGEAIVWDFVTPVNLEGTLHAGSAINPLGLTGQAWVDVDISEGPGSGNVYVLASVIRSGDPADVMFAKSTDGGLSFEAPIKVNTDISGNYNWFGTMSVAPNGRIDVAWLDTRDDSNNLLSRLYYSFSEDQGVTWSPNEPLSPPFDSTIGWPQQQKMGDYFDMVSDNDYAHLAWCNTLNGGQDVYYSRISPSEIILSNNDAAINSWNAIAYPNPFHGPIEIQFNVAEEQLVTIEVFDVLGRKLETLANDKMIGPQNISWDVSDDVSNGLYFITIQGVTNKQVIRVVKE
jgi:Secretion system C-terminal sorting domain